MTLKTIFMRLLEAQTANGVGGWPRVLSEGNLDLKGWTAWRHVKALFFLYIFHAVSVFSAPGDLSCSTSAPEAWIFRLAARSQP